jgi:cell division protein FtsB
LNKVANTYWDNLTTVSLAKKKRVMTASVQSKSKTPQWFIFTVTVSLTFMLCLAINFRAFSDLRGETAEFKQLNTEIKTLTTGNMVLQEEIQNLKSDPRTIEREARKIGMSRPNEKILVPIIK